MADDIGKDIKGTIQKVKGNIEMDSPHLDDKVKGAVDKVKGDWNRSTASDERRDDNTR